MFSENERQIFGPYFNGERSVYADPIRVHRRLYYKLDGEPNRYFQRLHILKDSEGNPLPPEKQVPEAERFAAKERVLEAAAYALDMLPFDPTSARGATENDIMAALKMYLEFRQSKKVNGPIPPSCSPPIQGSAPFSLTRPAIPSPMKPTTGFGSIPHGSGWPVRGK